jgi:DNA topoisomerase I
MAVKKTTKKTAKKQKKDQYLVIVESPAKSKTINKILGKEYKVIASMGHVIDLPSDKMGIDFENDFKAEYSVMKGRKKYVKEIEKEAKISKAVFLAADPDREGEAICWHIKNQLKKYDVDIFRVRFEEITAKAVKEAFARKDLLDQNKINAQQARRLLDRIVGYSISPLLWRRITRGLSAGRVQSVAVRLVVEREEAIKKFVPEEYWSLDAIMAKHGKSEDKDRFKAKLVKYQSKKIQVNSKEESDKIVADMEKEKFIVGDISRKSKKSYPRAPFTTSLLQQEAFNKINFSASKTMRVAQRLYEGIELGSEGGVGLITYMRTDSVRVSNDALDEVRQYILDNYGGEYHPDKPHTYKSKKRAQDAHEAIRPTLPLRSPEAVGQFLSPDESKLYELIWKRFVASQMSNAVYSVLAIHINAGDYQFRAGGAELVFDGFLKAYRDSAEVPEEMKEIPQLTEGEEVDLVELLPEQHFTKAPPRYSDASLVKDLEEKGIGRPSTYAPTLRTIIDRNYAKRVARYFHPTELGVLVNELLMEHFPNIFDYEFTARMEDALDEVEDGKLEWVEVLREFYGPFSEKLKKVKENVKNINKHEVPTDEICAQCGKPMIIKWGRRGRFLSCSDFPTCRNAKSITTGVKCPEDSCDGELVERKSFRGNFYGCTNYPKCTYTSKTLPNDAEGKDDKVEDV